MLFCRIVDSVVALACVAFSRTKNKEKFRPLDKLGLQRSRPKKAVTIHTMLGTDDFYMGKQFVETSIYLGVWERYLFKMNKRKRAVHKRFNTNHPFSNRKSTKSWICHGYVGNFGGYTEGYK